MAESERPLFAEVFSGSTVLPGEGWVGGASGDTRKDEEFKISWPSFCQARFAVPDNNLQGV